MVSETEAAPPGDETESYTPNPVVAALKKRPYLYGFILGALVLTLIRPCLTVDALTPPVGPKVQEFRLLDQRGAPFTNADLSGTTWIAGFFHTQTDKAGEIVFEAMKTVAGRSRKEGLDVHFVLFTVDPVRDTPAVLAEWARQRELSHEHWHLLTASGIEDIRAVAVDTFRAPFSSGTETKKAIHSKHLWIIDKDGFVREHPQQRRATYKTSVRNYDDVFEWARVVIRNYKKQP